MTMVLARRLHHDEGDIGRHEPLLQHSKAHEIVGNAERMAKRVHIDVEPGFTNINANINSRRSAWFGHILALHAGLAPFHLLRTSTKDERTKLTRGSCQGVYGPARPIPEGMAIPSGIDPNLQRFGSLHKHARGDRTVALPLSEYPSPARACALASSPPRGEETRIKTSLPSPAFVSARLDG